MPWEFLLGLGLFLGTAAAVLGIGGALLRHRPSEARSLETTALACAGIIGLLFLFQNLLSPDALRSYGPLRSAVVDGDLDLYEELVLRAPPDREAPAVDATIGPVGGGLIAAPAALAVRPVATLLARRDLVPGGDGYGPLETAAVTWTTLLAALGGMALTHRCARALAGRGASLIAVTALFYASPLAWFTFVRPGTAPAISVFLGAAFLCVWTREDGSPWQPLLLGLLGGVVALVNPGDAVYLALPALDAVLRGARPAQRMRSVRELGLLVLGALVGFAPQLAAGLARGALSLGNDRALAGGVLWMPLGLIGVAGILLLQGSHPRLVRGLLLLVALEALVGHQLVSAWPAMAIGLAVGIERLGRRVGLLAAGLVPVPFVYWSLLLMAQLRLEWIPLRAPVDLLATSVRQVQDAPAALVRGLCAPFGSNQVFFLEHLRAALDSGSLRTALAWLGSTAIAAGVLALWLSCLTRSGSLPELPRRVRADRRRALLLGAACLLGAIAVTRVAAGHDRSRLVAEVAGTPFVIPSGALREIGLEPSPGAPAGASRAIAWRASTRGDDPARLRVDLVSRLEHAETLQEGAIAAFLDLHGPGCPALSLPLRAGFETAETVRDEPHRASWPIAPGCRPDRVMLRVERNGADLEILRLCIALVPAGL